MKMGLKVPAASHGISTSAVGSRFAWQLTVLFCCPGVNCVFPCSFLLAISRSHPCNDSVSWGPPLVPTWGSCGAELGAEGAWLRAVPPTRRHPCPA